MVLEGTIGARDDDDDDDDIVSAVGAVDDESAVDEATVVEVPALAGVGVGADATEELVWVTIVGPPRLVPLPRPPRFRDEPTSL